jgi:hypothetical protein
MHSLARDFFHFCRDRVRAIAGEPIHACAYEEMALGRLGCTEQLIDVALTITDVNAAPWLTE